jgi:hypothetical protein
VGLVPDCTVAHFTLPAFFSVTERGKPVLMSSIVTPDSLSEGTTTSVMK